MLPFTFLQSAVLGARVLPFPPLVLLVPRNEAVMRSGKAGKALEKSRQQVEEGNKEAAQLKVLLFIPPIFRPPSLESAFSSPSLTHVALRCPSACPLPVNSRNKCWR